MRARAIARTSLCCIIVGIIMRLKGMGLIDIDVSNLRLRYRTLYNIASNTASFAASIVMIPVQFVVDINERMRIAENERIERERVEKQIREEERRRQLELQRLTDAWQEALGELLDGIDFYMRTRRRFDSKKPLEFSCNIGSISQDKTITDYLNAYNEALAAIGYDKNNIRTVIEANEEAFTCIDDTVRLRHLTPFQGDDSHRVFGYFECGSCKREWASASTWKNKWQKCQRCEAKCFPYQQHPLDISDHDHDHDERRPHDDKRCQRCLEMKRICCPGRFFSMHDK